MAASICARNTARRTDDGYRSSCSATPSTTNPSATKCDSSHRQNQRAPKDNLLPCSSKAQTSPPPAVTEHWMKRIFGISAKTKTSNQSSNLIGTLSTTPIAHCAIGKSNCETRSATKNGLTDEATA